MMFVIGLEMRTDELWAIRRTIFGYGGVPNRRDFVVCKAHMSNIAIRPKSNSNSP
jgi:glutathione-regulated potassium-efflux system ancillary protein KefC